MLTLKIFSDWNNLTYLLKLNIYLKNGKKCWLLGWRYLRGRKVQSSDIEPLVVKTHPRYYAYNLVCKLSVLSSKDSSAALVSNSWNANLKVENISYKKFGKRVCQFNTAKAINFFRRKPYGFWIIQHLKKVKTNIYHLYNFK